MPLAPAPVDEDDDDLDDDEDVVADDEVAPAAAGDRRAAEAALLYGHLRGVDLGLDAHLHADGSPRIVERRFVVADELAGHRLDHYLKRMIPRLSRTRIQAIVRTQLRRDGDDRPPKPSSPVAAGETYVIRRAARPEPPCPRTFAVLHDDDDVLVIDKPAGLPVHASAKFYFNTLTRVLSERFPGARLQICHRLDRETSGALVIARSPEAAAVVKGAFAAKQVAKAYLAIVHGQPPWPDESGDDGPAHVIDLPLRLSTERDPTRVPGVRMIAGAGGLPSVTRVRVVERAGALALVRCIPVTGRQHQIRAHLAAAGFPIAGDKLYAHGDEAFMRFCDTGLTPDLVRLFGLPRQALHAARVRFPHPRYSKQIQVDSPIPEELFDFLRRGGARVC